MSDFGKLNETGIQKFKGYLMALKAGGKGTPPVQLCYDRQTSDALPFDIEPEDAEFADRVTMGKCLRDLIQKNDDTVLYDPGFWTAMSLIWFDKICPPDNNGARLTLALNRYIFDSNQLKADRHILWGAWWAINTLGDDGEFFLRQPVGSKNDSLQYHGEIMNRFASNQLVASVPGVIQLTRLLFQDDESKCPKKGTSGRGSGSPNHLVRLLKQFELTYDFHHMSPDALRGLLPKDFDKWDKAS